MNRHPLVRRETAALVLALALALRGTAAWADTVSESVVALRSWAGATEMTAQAWIAHDVPTHFARRTFAAARHALAERAGELARDAASPDAAQAAAAVAALDAVLSRLQASVARDDRDAAGALLRRVGPLVRHAA